MVKNLPAKQQIQVGSMSWEDPLETGTATHSSILAWRFHDRGTWQVTRHRVMKSWARLKQQPAHMHRYINVVEKKEQNSTL